MLNFALRALAVCALFAATSATADTPVERMKEFYVLADERPFDPEKIAVFLSADFVDHDPGPGSTSGRDYVVGVFTQLANGAPDSKHEIEFIEPVGDNKALVRWQYVGTHTGTMFGFPATGNAINISGLELWEFNEDGVAVGLWHIEELATLFQQLTPK